MGRFSLAMMPLALLLAFWFSGCEVFLDEVGQEIFDKIVDIARGEKTKSEDLGHQEFVLTYKSFEPIGPACLPI